MDNKTKFIIAVMFMAMLFGLYIIFCTYPADARVLGESSWQVLEEVDDGSGGKKIVIRNTGRMPSMRSNMRMIAKRMPEGRGVMVMAVAVEFSVEELDNFDNVFLAPGAGWCRLTSDIPTTIPAMIRDYRSVTQHDVDAFNYVSASNGEGVRVKMVGDVLHLFIIE